jgi:membrane peptidoglycan carboxypeptidase
MSKLAGVGGGATYEELIRALQDRVGRVESRRILRICRWALTGVIITLLVAVELRTSWLQSRFLSATAKRLTFEVRPGASPAALTPADGPYDRRLGYAGLPRIQLRLSAGAFETAAQARPSEQLLRLRNLGLYPAYLEKSQAGLRILDHQGRVIFARPYPERVYTRFEEIPPVVVKSLLFVENRELLAARSPYRNPAIEWDRLAKAMLDLGLEKVLPGHPVSGGGTLATQLVKVRHSPGGRTASVGEKFRQIATASIGSYLHGEETLAARRRIGLDYINSLPLAALPGYGEVNGLGDGLWYWFGEDFEKVNRLLALPVDGAEDPRQLEAQALAYREALSLLLAVKRPGRFLMEDRLALAVRVDNYLRLLAEEGVIGPRLRDAALAAPDMGRFRLHYSPPREPPLRKAAASVRVELMNLLGIDSAYDLDRLDLTARTTLDEQADVAAAGLLRNLTDPDFAERAAITGYRLLDPSGAGSVIYSFSLYERTPAGNLLRVQVDNFNQPLNINQGTKLELGSTAKLRTLVTYLEVVEKLHRKYAGVVTASHRPAVGNPQDRLSRWAIDYLAASADKSLPAMLEAAMRRTYSASPGEAFFTGGGLHTFANFDRKDNGRVMTVREAFQRSVNLVFIRLMRDLVNYHMFRKPGVTPAILEDPGHPKRREYLEQFADFEGKEFLRRFYSKYEGQSPGQALQKLIDGLVATPKRLAVIFRSVRPQATLEEFAAFMRGRPAAQALSPKRIEDLYHSYGPDRFDLNDRGYLARIHPLELWLLEHKQRQPGATLSEVFAASAGQRREVYRWLFRPNKKQGQDIRIRAMLEMDAFEEIHRRWSRLGYPFASLVPSYATAIGSSGDNPAALAELLGVLVNDGVRYPSLRVQELHFAARTPFETVMRRKPAQGQRVLSPLLAGRVREELLGVVAKGTARRALGSVVLSDGRTLPVGGKTGTGDNRLHVYGPGGVELASKAVNRTAAFVFTIGDRFYGTVMAFVPGAEAESFEFTSALPVQVFTQLMPAVRPLLERVRSS